MSTKQEAWELWSKKHPHQARVRSHYKKKVASSKPLTKDDLGQIRFAMTCSSMNEFKKSQKRTPEWWANRALYAAHKAESVQRRPQMFFTNLVWHT